MTYFKIRGPITQVETFVIGTKIRERARLRRRYGSGRWRKRKGVAEIALPDGTLRTAELHWYEATGVGRVEYKIKRFV